VLYTPSECKVICAGKKRNIKYKQCRDDEGKVVSMERIGTCPTPTSSSTEEKDIEKVEVER